MATGFKTGGRKKGVPNKMGLSLKSDVMEAFENVGGVAWLEDLAQTDKRTFAALLAKLLPTEITAEIDTNHNIVFKTVYQTAPETVPDALPYDPPPIIDAMISDAAEPIEIKPGPASSSPE